jgi:N utilization substance protein A
LLLRLFEMEVPEIYDGTVVIKSAVREPGERAKIAVTSNERDVDPVGACVGMKGSRVQAIIRELRGEKIDIIEWSDEPSVFAANALSPAKVNQVRITDIENRQMEVIVNEDQLSLAIGKRGQNVRLATKLVGWNIDIRSEEEIKREVSEQMGALIASGAAVPLSAIEGVTAQQTDTLAEHGINDIEALAHTSVDDLVEFLDVSLDEAETILSAAKAVIAMRDTTLQGTTAEAPETDETEDVYEPAAAATESAPEYDDTASGYDEAVQTGVPYSAEPEILAQYSADPVAVTESEPISTEELILQEPGRDLRPDTITPAPDITSSGAASMEYAAEVQEDGLTLEEVAALETSEDNETASATEDAAADGSSDDEKQDASPDAAQ